MDNPFMKAFGEESVKYLEQASQTRGHPNYFGQHTVSSIMGSSYEFADFLLFQSKMLDKVQRHLCLTSFGRAADVQVYTKDVVPIRRRLEE